MNKSGTIPLKYLGKKFFYISWQLGLLGKLIALNLITIAGHSQASRPNNRIRHFMSNEIQRTPTGNILYFFMF